MLLEELEELELELDEEELELDDDELEEDDELTLELELEELDDVASCRFWNVTNAQLGPGNTSTSPFCGLTEIGVHPLLANSLI